MDTHTIRSAERAIDVMNMLARVERSDVAGRSGAGSGVPLQGLDPRGPSRRHHPYRPKTSFLALPFNDHRLTHGGEGALADIRATCGESDGFLGDVGGSSPQLPAQRRRRARTHPGTEWMDTPTGTCHESRVAVL